MRKSMWAAAALLLTVVPAAAAVGELPSAAMMAAAPARRSALAQRTQSYRATAPPPSARHSKPVRAEKLQRDLNRILLERIQGTSRADWHLPPEIWSKTGQRG